MDFFTHPFSQLEVLLQKLEVDSYVEDQVLSIEFEEHFVTKKLTFAVLADEDVSVFYTLLEVSSIVDFITDEIVACEVDDMPLLMLNGINQVFIFVKEIHATEADELVNSLL
jgi:hypothetical protein